jgi:hypothetical protein
MDDKERDLIKFINQKLSEPQEHIEDLEVFVELGPRTPGEWVKGHRVLDIKQEQAPRERGRWVQGLFVEEILPGQSPIVPAPPQAARPRPRKVTGRDYYMCWCGETFPTEEAIMAHTHRDGKLRIGWRGRAP